MLTLLGNSGKPITHFPESFNDILLLFFNSPQGNWSFTLFGYTPPSPIYGYLTVLPSTIEISFKISKPCGSVSIIHAFNDELYTKYL